MQNNILGAGNPIGAITKTLLGINATIAKYAGTDDEDTNVDSYIEELKRFCLQTGREVIQVCHDSFVGEAKDWLKDYVKNGPLANIPATDYLPAHIRTFYTALKDRFTLTEAQKQSSYAAAFQSRQDPGEKYPAFVSRIQKLCKNLGMSEKHTLAICMQGANVQLQPFLLTSSPKTIQELLRLPIARLEQLPQVKHELIATLQEDSSAHSSKPDRLDQVSQLFTAQITALNTRLDKLTATPSTSESENRPNKYNNGGASGTSKEPDHATQLYTAQIAALTNVLDKLTTPPPTHGANNRPNKYNGGGAPTSQKEPRKCYKCGYTDCPFLLSNGNTRDRQKCPAADHLCKCGILGHWDNLCKKESREQNKSRRFRQSRSDNSRPGDDRQRDQRAFSQPPPST